MLKLPIKLFSNNWKPTTHEILIRSCCVSILKFHFGPLGEDAPSVQGFDAVKTVFTELFKLSPDLHSTVLNRSVIGPKVIDYERIQGRKGVKTDVFLVMIYEVKDGKIWRAWAVRE